MTRPSREDWLFGLATAVGAIADCTRRQVGAVIYDPATMHIVSTGYNGRPAGLPGCLSEGACPRGQSDVASRSSYQPGQPGACDAIHAEDNALRRARERGLSVAGMSMVVTCEPCPGCYALINHYGITAVYFAQEAT